MYLRFAFFLFANKISNIKLRRRNIIVDLKDYSMVSSVTISNFVHGTFREYLYA